MDRERFDALARLLATKASRRATLGAVLSGFLPGEPGVLAKDDRRKGKRRGKDRHNSRNTRRKQRVFQAEAARCCKGGRCSPGPGQNLFKCCLEDADLAGQNLKGANLGSANFAGATLTKANFTGANLDKTCLVDADVRGARFGGANTGTAIFCRTQTDAGEDNSGCVRGSLCCPTCDAAHQCGVGQLCCNGRCRTGDCCDDGVCTDPAEPVCVRNRCSPCTANRQCGSGNICCDGRCIANTLCCNDDASACPGPGECRVRGCNEAGECAPRPATDTPCTLGTATGVCCDGVCEDAGQFCGGVCGNVCSGDRPDCSGSVCACRGNGLTCPPEGDAGCCGGGCKQVLFGRVCCTLTGRACATGEQCCSGGCELGNDFIRRCG